MATGCIAGVERGLPSWSSWRLSSSLGELFPDTHTHCGAGYVNSAVSVCRSVHKLLLCGWSHSKPVGEENASQRRTQHITLKHRCARCCFWFKEQQPEQQHATPASWSRREGTGGIPRESLCRTFSLKVQQHLRFPVMDKLPLIDWKKYFKWPYLIPSHC